MELDLRQRINRLTFPIDSDNFAAWHEIRENAAKMQFIDLNEYDGDDI